MISRDQALRILDKYQDADVADIKTIKQFINTIYDSMKPQIDSRFYQAIKDGTCTLAVLNSPCMLGVYELPNVCSDEAFTYTAGCFKVEVVGCLLVHFNINEDGFKIKPKDEKIGFKISLKHLGFITPQEAYDYYSENLKSDVAYLISFKRVD